MTMIKILHPPLLIANLRHKEGFYISEGYLFREGKLCILVKESHEWGLMGHFGVDKTLDLLKEKLF